jgi:hypothetical protein
VSATATPKQGDHVFNAVDTALMRPFETVKSLRSPIIQGQHFVHDYLLQSYSMATQIAGCESAVAQPSRSSQWCMTAIKR